MSPLENNQQHIVSQDSWFYILSADRIVVFWLFATRSGVYTVYE